MSYNAGGPTWTTIATEVPMSARSIPWTVPSIRARNCAIVVESEQHPRIQAKSGRFAIR